MPQHDTPVIKKYQPRTELIESQYTHTDGVATFGIDFGYSETNGVTQNKRFSFPSYARPMAAQDVLSMTGAGDDDIFWSDHIWKENGYDTRLDGIHVWAVGARAQKAAKVNELDWEMLYGRDDRYASQMFRVIVETALGLALMGNGKGCVSPDHEILLQSGLPMQYFKTDAAAFRESMIGTHNFSIKIGNGPWTNFTNIILGENNVPQPIPQPMSLYMMVGLDCEARATEFQKNARKRSVLVVDIGQGTADTLYIKSGMAVQNKSLTLREYGMDAVYTEMSNRMQRTGLIRTRLQTADIYKALDNEGIYKFYDPDKKKVVKVNIAPFLAEALDTVRDSLFQRLDTSYDYYTEIDTIIIGGGVMEIWGDAFVQHVHGINEDVEVVRATKNMPELDGIYAVAMGYYLYQTGAARGRKKRPAK